MSNRIDVLIIIVILLIVKQSKTLEVILPNSIKGNYYHIEGHFGPSIKALNPDVAYTVVSATPDLGACSVLSALHTSGNVVLILRGASTIKGEILNPDYQCRFTTKVLYAQQAGAVAVIIGNNVGDGITPMYEDNPDHSQIMIPSISVSYKTFQTLYNQITQHHEVKVEMNEHGQMDDIQFNTAIERWIAAVLSTLMLLASISLMIAGILSFRILLSRLKMLWSSRQRRLRMMTDIPTIRYSQQLIINGDKSIHTDDAQIECHPISISKISSELMIIPEENIKLIEQPFIGNAYNPNTNTNANILHNETCNVCLEDFIEGEKIRVLRCKHGFHDKCIQSWIINKNKCPVCIQTVFSNDTDYQQYL